MERLGGHPMLRDKSLVKRPEKILGLKMKE